MGHDLKWGHAISSWVTIPCAADTILLYKIASPMLSAIAGAIKSENGVMQAKQFGDHQINSVLFPLTSISISYKIYLTQISWGSKHAF